MIDDIERYRIYILTGCSFCKKAVNLLLEKKKCFSVTVLDHDMDTLNKLKEKHEWNTVPLIVATTKEEKELFLGGFSDLEKTFGV